MVGITFFGFIGVLYQIHRMTKANSISSVAALLQIESSLSQNRQRIDQAAVAMAHLTARRQSGVTVQPAEIEACTMEMNGAIQNYLNSLDRLCACILRDILREDHAKQDYRDLINAAIANYKDEFDTVIGRYYHILKLRDRWREK